MKRVFVIIPVLAVLILSISFLVGSLKTNAQTKVTKDDVLNVLNLKDSSYFGNLINKIKLQGVGFEPTDAILKEFRDKGATEDLIKAIQENSPKPISSPILIVTPTPEPTIATPKPTPTPPAGLGPLTLEKIILGLTSKAASIGQLNVFTTKEVTQRGVDFELTPDKEKQLRAVKASPNLIKAIKENGPGGVVDPPPTNDSTFKNIIGMELVLVKAGSFMMGTNIKSKILTSQIETIDKAEADYYKDLIKEDESQVRKVTFKEPFYMGKTEVTQAQWESVMGISLRQIRDKLYTEYHKDPDDKLSGVGPNYPMYFVSWNDAKEFVRKLNEMDKEYEYSLPSEAQWEYACKAGTSTDYAGILDNLAWYSNNSGVEYRNSDDEWEKAGNSALKYQNNYEIPNKNSSHEVGTKKPNAFGLYDMHGNVGEWCEDIYDFNYQGLPTDGSANLAIKDSRSRVYRGGSWRVKSEFLRSAYRNKFLPDNKYIDLGFRVVARRK